MESIDTELLQAVFVESDYTYTELANVVGISRNTVHNIMFGLTSPSYYVITSIAAALELSEEEIIAIFFPNLKMKFRTKKRISHE